MKRLAQTLGLCLLMTTPAIAQENYVSEVWVADQGNGTYKNPILYADYSDPDACRVGDDFYMTSSSFNCLPRSTNTPFKRPCKLEHHRCCRSIRPPSHRNSRTSGTWESSMGTSHPPS